VKKPRLNYVALSQTPNWLELPHFIPAALMWYTGRLNGRRAPVFSLGWSSWERICFGPVSSMQSHSITCCVLPTGISKAPALTVKPCVTYFVWSVLSVGTMNAAHLTSAGIFSSDTFLITGMIALQSTSAI
jgi:hypothetical protein